MARKRALTVPKTSLQGKQQKTTNSSEKNQAPTKPEENSVIAPELKYKNIGNFKKSGKKEQIAKLKEDTDIKCKETTITDEK